MKYSMLIFALIFVGLIVLSPQSAQTQGNIVGFGGDLDRPVTAEQADKQEKKDGGDEPPIPDDPEDDDEEPPVSFMDEEIEGHRIVFILDRSGSMSSRHNPGFPVYDSNGNVISYPSRWQTTQSQTASAIGAMTEEDSFDVISFGTSIYVCFGSLMTATGNAKAQAISWIYSQYPTGCTNSYDALVAGFSNYGQVDTIIFLSDGYPNTALSRGCSACACSFQVQQWILSESDAWIATQASMYEGFRFLVMQIGGSPMNFMTQLGSKPHSNFYLK